MARAENEAVTGISIGISIGSQHRHRQQHPHRRRHRHTAGGIAPYLLAVGRQAGVPTLRLPTRGCHLDLPLPPVIDCRQMMTTMTYRPSSDELAEGWLVQDAAVTADVCIARMLEDGVDLLAEQRGRLIGGKTFFILAGQHCFGFAGFCWCQPLVATPHGDHVDWRHRDTWH